MTYSLAFTVSALKDWRKLDGSIQHVLKRKLADRLSNPRVPSARLTGPSPDRYKIKLRDVRYRLVYEVSDRTVTVTVIAVGRRDDIYETAATR